MLAQTLAAPEVTQASGHVSCFLFPVSWRDENINFVLYDYSHSKTKESKSESRPNHIVDVLK